jgi:hypothetical protein
MCGDEEGRVFIIPEPAAPEIKDSKQAFGFGATGTVEYLLAKFPAKYSD